MTEWVSILIICLSLIYSTLAGESTRLRDLRQRIVAPVYPAPGNAQSRRIRTALPASRVGGTDPGLYKRNLNSLFDHSNEIQDHQTRSLIRRGSGDDSDRSKQGQLVRPIALRPGPNSILPHNHRQSMDGFRRPGRNPEGARFARPVGPRPVPNSDPRQGHQQPAGSFRGSGRSRKRERSPNLNRNARPPRPPRPAEAGHVLHGPSSSMLSSNTRLISHENLPPSAGSIRKMRDQSAAIATTVTRDDGIGIVASRGQKVSAFVDTSRGGEAIVKTVGSEGITKTRYPPGERDFVTVTDNNNGQAKVQAAIRGDAQVTTGSSNE